MCIAGCCQTLMAIVSSSHRPQADHPQLQAAWQQQQQQALQVQAGAACDAASAAQLASRRISSPLLVAWSWAMICQALMQQAAQQQRLQQSSCLQEPAVQLQEA
jgi:hypothetical protein